MPAYSAMTVPPFGITGNSMAAVEVSTVVKQFCIRSTKCIIRPPRPTLIECQCAAHVCDDGHVAHVHKMMQPGKDVLHISCAVDVNLGVWLCSAQTRQR